MMVLDHTQDISGVEQHRLTQLYPLPDFVKQASHDQLYGDVETLPAHVYGLTAKRLFPCHTKAATWMSSLFFADKRDSLPAPTANLVENRLRKSAEYWQILPQVDALWEKIEKRAGDDLNQLPDENFALVWTVGDAKHRHYPLRNAMEVKQASHWFGKNHDDFTFDDKHQIATKILSRADTYGAVIEHSELLHKCAGYGYCAASTAAEAWEKRATLLKRSHADLSQGAQELADRLRTTMFDVGDHGIRIKLASFMDQLDRTTNLSRLYDDGGLERPEDILFGVTEKVAADFLAQHVTTTTGAIYDKLSLEKLELEKLAEWMGEDFAESVNYGGAFVDIEKLATILPTLPRPDAAMFDRMAASCQIPVLAREQAVRDDHAMERRAAFANQYDPSLQDVTGI